MKRPEALSKEELTEEEQAEVEDWEMELEAFEIHEMPVLLRLIELHTELEPEETLEALHASFYLGLKRTRGFDLFWRGKLPVEAAYHINDYIEAGDWTYLKAGDLLKNTLAYARMEYEKANNSN